MVEISQCLWTDFKHLYTWIIEEERFLSPFKFISGGFAWINKTEHPKSGIEWEIQFKQFSPNNTAAASYTKLSIHLT